MPRPQVLLLLAAVAALVAGCAGSEPTTTASFEAQRAGKANAMLAAPPGSDVVPTGVVRDFTLYLHRMETHELYPGASMPMWGMSLSDDPASATVPGPTLRVNEGDTVEVTFVVGFAGFEHTLHWHGQHVPPEMDGVPYMSQDPVKDGESFTYVFVAKPAGTYWYHCHVDAQHHIDMGMYGAFIVDPIDPSEEPAYDSEFLLMLDDMDRYHIESGTTPGGNLPQNADPFSYEVWLRRQVSDTINRNQQIQDTTAATGVRPQRSAEYGYPVTHPAYTASYNTYLINGVAFPYTQPLNVKDGDVARIRLVNVGNELFTMHLHGHHFLVTHKDGILLDSPYWADVVAIAPGERYDLYVKLDNPGVWDFHDHIGWHTQNDWVFPGGAMTMLCYESTGKCDGTGHQHGGARHSGDILGWTGNDLP